jgi:CO/xanthine dehydrogenase FAD-binding subunit
MKPPPFVYAAPRSVEEVLALLAQHGADARLLAGGQSLVPLMNLRMARPAVLIDLNRCAALGTIAPTDEGISYGAMVRQMDAQLSEHSRTCCPLLCKALAHAGPVAVRNRATIGGTLAHADRAAELPGVAVALNATLVVERAAGRRLVPAEEFFLGDMTTALQPGELLRAAIFPAAASNSYSAFLEVGIRREGIAMVGLAANLVLGDDNIVRDARLAVIGVEPAPVRLKAVEQQLRDQQLNPAVIARAGELARDGVDPMDDAQLRAEYRKHITATLVKRALEGALSGGAGGHDHA